MRVSLRLVALFRRNPAGVLFAAMFLLAGAPFGAIYATMVPVGQGADEQLHAMRVYSLAHGQFTGHRMPFPNTMGGTTLETGVVIDPALSSVLLISGVGTTKAMSLGELVMIDHAGWSDLRLPALVHTIGSYFPIFHLPAAAVMAVAGPLHLLPARAVLTARFVNLGTVLLLGVAAMLLAERGRAVLLTVLLLPITLSLAATLTSDGLMLATAVLAAALLTREDARLHPGDRWPSPSWWAAAAALCAIGLTKPPYAALLAVLLLPLPRWRDWRACRSGLGWRIGLVALLCVPILAWSAYISAFVVSEANLFNYDPGPWWPGPPGTQLSDTNRSAQLAILVADPWRIVRLMGVLRQFRAMDLIGVLGRLDAALPPWSYRVWSAAAIIAVLSEMVGGRGTGRSLRLGDTLLLATSLGLATVGICMSLYVTWTPVGLDHVDGMQGRYLVPLCPFLVLVLPRVGLPGGTIGRAFGLAAPGAAAIAAGAAMPFIFLFYYYLR